MNPELNSGGQAVLNKAYPAKLLLFTLVSGVLLFLLRFIGPDSNLIASWLLVALCGPGFMIGLSLSIALRFRSTTSSPQVILFNGAGLVMVILFVAGMFGNGPGG